VKLALGLVLLVITAAGLSSLRSDGFCQMRPGVDDSPNIGFAAWPPGSACTYSDGARIPFGSAGGFLAILAAGGIALWRRHRYSLATLNYLGLAGFLTLEFQFHGLALSLMLGSVLALIAYRRFFASCVGLGVVFLGGFAYLAGAGAYGWAVLVALVPLCDRFLRPLDERLVRYFVSPHPEFERWGVVGRDPGADEPGLGDRVGR
jgi:hypothetical protein